MITHNSKEGKKTKQCDSQIRKHKSHKMKPYWKLIPLTDHDHNEPKIYNDSLLHHASVFEHQGHGHQSKGPAPYLPEMSKIKT